MQKETLAGLVTNYDGGIRIPMIQRDYAQGRPSWENSRNRFLSDIRESLIQERKPLHLDFVYGIKQDEDGSDAFCPLDGQQRLTTLFLLHWYLAARDGCFADFQDVFRNASDQSRFTYQVRPGGRAFFQALVEQAPSAQECKTTQPTEWFRQQFWFRSIWERDPSVAGALVMLDAIHLYFKDHSKATFRNLMEGDRITFQRLDLDAVGLHDDLYLRMNARGRPLTTFETFKARFVKLLENKFPGADQLGSCTVKSAKDFANRIDTAWLDFIWNHYGPTDSNSDDTSFVDDALINLFRAVALASLEPTKVNAEKIAEKKDSANVSFLAQGKKGEQGKQIFPDYDDFEIGGWLTTKFTTHLIHVLEACESCKEVGSSSDSDFILFQPPWFGRDRLLDLVVRHGDKKPDYADFLQFAACIRFLTAHGPLLNNEHRIEFHEWNRVVRNLVVNSDVRAETFLEILSGLDQLVKGSEDKGILAFLAEAEGKLPGFHEDQTIEERFKARLIQAGDSWRSRIYIAENHDYFRGQIGFLLEFSGADPRAQNQTSAQNHFDTYLQRASEMFGPGGLNSEPAYLWERALLAIHDFFAGEGWQIWSFLENERGSAPAWKQTSWKRLLRDSGNRRSSLKTLWDRMTTETLEQIAGDLPVEPWRNAMCSRADLWKYCGKRLVRYEERAGREPQVYLLSAKRRRAAYAELFTYRLMKMEELEQNRSRFAPLEFVRLVDDTGSDDDPHLMFELSLKDAKHPFLLHCQYANDDGFSLWTPAKDLQSELLHLMKNTGFVSETHGTTEFRVLRQQPGDPLEGSAFIETIVDALKQTFILQPS